MTPHTTNETLVRTIKDHWAARGFYPEVRLVKAAPEASFEVRSDMRNGMPVGVDGVTIVREQACGQKT